MNTTREQEHVVQTLGVRFHAVDDNASRGSLKLDQGAGAALILEFDAAGDGRGGFQVAIKIEDPERRRLGRAFDRVEPGR